MAVIRFGRLAAVTGRADKVPIQVLIQAQLRRLDIGFRGLLVPTQQARDHRWLDWIGWPFSPASGPSLAGCRELLGTNQHNKGMTA